MNNGLKLSIGRKQFQKTNDLPSKASGSGKTFSTKATVIQKWLKNQMSPVFAAKSFPQRFFIVIDALDELTKPEFENFSSLANQLDVPGVHLVTTCRTLQWKSRRGLLNWDNLKSLELASLKRHQKMSFIRQFFNTQELQHSGKKLLQSNPAIEYATDNSLILTFVCFLHRGDELDENST